MLLDLAPLVGIDFDTTNSVIALPNADGKPVPGTKVFLAPTIADSPTAMTPVESIGAYDSAVAQNEGWGVFACDRRADMTPCVEIRRHLAGNPFATDEYAR